MTGITVVTGHPQGHNSGKSAFLVNRANDEFVNAYTESDCECAAWQCASNCACKDFWYAWRFGRWLESWARKDTAGQAEQQASTGMSESHLVTRMVGFFI